MIVRLWRGRSAAAEAEAYSEFLRECAYPDYGEADGNRGWMLLRRPLGEFVELMLVSFWDSMDALVKYAEGDPDRPKYYPEDRAALVDPPDRVDHFEIVDLQPRW